ncbi:hypothetical protein [Glaciibacter psychrotolerans]|uniref:Uncharacterized protein n=1 Tax=Glaciibacter psychrotolerans TaxID=670054 RepID=A0A7Z0J5A1_9MICO|nr:hypothetical protein [Leifsonia psychrotolerans]NYJ18891.1 hypothetical protein [Leifsonia psychrotolerans]
MSNTDTPTPTLTTEAAAPAGVPTIELIGEAEAGGCCGGGACGV